MIAHAALAWLLVAGVGPPGEIEDRALNYLASTTHEIGMDVLVMGQIYQQLSGDPRGGALSETRLGDVRSNDLDRYRALLSMSKPALDPVPLPQLDRSVDHLSTGMIDNGSIRCPLEALGCQISAECVGYLNGEGPGRIVTHQALTLMFASWSGCELPVDVEERHGAYAAQILQELAADSEASDLFFERLAILAHLGYAESIREDWIRTVSASQRPEGCFPASRDHPCHPHPTGLVLWLIGNLTSQAAAVDGVKAD